MIAGILLASGASSRFGGDKLLATLDGRPLVHWSAEAIVGGVDELVAVVREESSAIREALNGLPIHWAVNHDTARGMSSAIRVGIAALSRDAEAAIVALGDQPLVDVGVVERLVACWRERGARAVQPRYDDGRGHPVLFDCSVFPALRSLEGDVGARAVLDSLGDALELLTVAGPRPMDVDTPEALRAAEAALTRRRRD